MSIERSSITPCDTSFPPAAREFVRSVLAQHGLQDTAPTVDLLVSELVTHAMVGGQFEHAWVEVRVTDEVLRVEVTDPSSLLAAVVADLPLEHTLRAGGIGMLLVDRTARGWGVAAAGDGTTLWFELDLADAAAPVLEGAKS